MLTADMTSSWTDFNYNSDFVYSENSGFQYVQR